MAARRKLTRQRRGLVKVVTREMCCCRAQAAFAHTGDARWPASQFCRPVTYVPAAYISSNASRSAAGSANLNRGPVNGPVPGSAARSGSGSDGKQIPEERILKAGCHSGIERISTIQISKATTAEGNIQTDGHGFSRRHQCNWVDANEEEDDEDLSVVCMVL
ncbi:hypothetical protein NL676_028594 [Syzygium grande]|nr:hypothetical protein NL676_028594 [Syzygium grande]